MAFCHNEERAQPHEGRSSFMSRVPDLMTLRDQLPDSVWTTGQRGTGTTSCSTMRDGPHVRQEATFIDLGSAILD